MLEYKAMIDGLGPIELVTPNVCLPWIDKQRTGGGDFWENLIREDWEPIKNAVNWDKVGAVLDIGAGVGGIDVLLWKKCRPALCLLDYDKSAPKLKYGMQPTGEPYNSMKATEQMQKRNGVQGVEYYTPEDVDKGALMGRGFDLIISCLSWGYHYPVQTYLKAAYETIKEDGAIIIDVRADDDKRWRIPVETMFRDWRILARGNKREKIIIRGPK